MTMNYKVMVDDYKSTKEGAVDAVDAVGAVLEHREHYCDMYSIGDWQVNYFPFKSNLVISTSKPSPYGAPTYGIPEPEYHSSMWFDNSDEMLDFAVRVIQVLQMEKIYKKMPNFGMIPEPEPDKRYR